MPYTFLHMFIEHLVCLRWAPQSEVCFPAPQFLIQPVAHFLPWSHIAGRQMLCHFLPDPLHALLRRATADVLSPRSPAEVRSEGVTQKVESLLTRVANARLPFVESQSQPFQHPTRPFQCLVRFSATEYHEIVRVVHDFRPVLLPTFGLLPSLQHPVHVEVRQQGTDHSPLPRSLSLPPVSLFFPFSSRSSTGTFNHIFTRCSRSEE